MPSEMTNKLKTCKLKHHNSLLRSTLWHIARHISLLMVESNSLYVICFLPVIVTHCHSLPKLHSFQDIMHFVLSQMTITDLLWSSQVIGMDTLGNWYEVFPALANNHLRGLNSINIPSGVKGVGQLPTTIPGRDPAFCVIPTRSDYKMTERWMNVITCQITA